MDLFVLIWSKGEFSPLVKLSFVETWDGPVHCQKMVHFRILSSDDGGTRRLAAIPEFKATYSHLPTRKGFSICPELVPDKFWG